MTAAKTGIPEVIGADVPCQHRQAGQVGLQARCVGAAVDIDKRLDIEVEQVERHLEHAHVGIDPDHRDPLDAIALEAPGQVVRQPGATWLGVDSVLGDEARQCRDDLCIWRLGARIPIEQAPKR